MISKPSSRSALRERLIGLRVLYEPRSAANTIKLVLVHGLVGSAIDTWTNPDSNIFWPALLYEDDRFANVRIATFGYDSGFQNIVSRTSSLGIADFAKQLLDGLDVCYDNPKYGDVRALPLVG